MPIEAVGERAEETTEIIEEGSVMEMRQEDQVLAAMRNMLQGEFDKLRAEIVSLKDEVSELKKQPAQKRRVPLKEAALLLGHPYSTMLEKVKAGMYREGHEVFDTRVPGAAKADWVADVEACKARQAKPPSKRAA